MRDAWAAFTDPLSRQEYKQLAWLGMRLSATFFVPTVCGKQEIDLPTARRLAFARWMYITHRLNEGIS